MSSAWLHFAYSRKVAAAYAKPHDDARAAGMARLSTGRATISFYSVLACTLPVIFRSIFQASECVLRLLLIHAVAPSHQESKSMLCAPKSL